MTHKSQRIEPFYKWLEDLNSLLEMSQRIKPFLKKNKITRRIDLLKNINQIIETFWWLKELNNFFETWLKESNNFFFFECDPKNRPFSENMFKELFSVFSALLKEWNIWEFDSKISTFLFSYDSKHFFSKNWTFFSWTFFDLTQTSFEIKHD